MRQLTSAKTVVHMLKNQADVNCASYKHKCWEPLYSGLGQ